MANGEKQLSEEEFSHNKDWRKLPENIRPNENQGTMEMSDLVFEKIREFFHERTGNWLGEEKRYLVLYRLSSLVGDQRLYKNYEAIHHRLVEDPYGEDAHQIITRLTTHYSYFFRESEHFQFFQHYLLRNKHKSEEIRIWSGAASTGEEAYSLAISSILCLPQHYSKVKILGTDISKESIEAARKGLYNRGVVEQSLPPNLCREFFDSIGEKCRIKDAPRSLVQFSNLNLLAPYPFKKKFQFIFLRNIFYYLNAQGREEVLDNLEPYLEKGGYLVLGRMDTAPLNKRSYKPEGENIFRKV
ncbi:MAG: hypothetical protein PF447_13620 [Spirochaetaceae bacterium]|jgi:chemotaxis protein methyltransferase CheR|nr:hypothetical protein [Spirochaetaceae bacterium]